MQQKSSNNRRWRWITLFMFIGTGIGLLFSETWIYRTFPSTCPFSKYLPDGAVATKCEYEGLIDFSVEFQANGSEVMFQTFVENIKNSMLNPVVVPEVSIVSGSKSVNVLTITSDHGVQATLDWSDHTIFMEYLDY